MNEIVVLIDPVARPHVAHHRMLNWQARQPFKVDLMRIRRNPVAGQHHAGLWILHRVRGQRPGLSRTQVSLRLAISSRLR